MKTAMQELFSQLELEHPNLFNTNTLEGRKFINDYYKFFELEKKQIINAWELEGDEYVRNGKDYYDVTFGIKQI
jgi:hypothetical protein